MKQKNYAWLAVLMVLLMAAVHSILPSVLYPTKIDNKIVKENASNQRLDYSDQTKLDNIKSLFGRGCLTRPCPYGICQGYVGRASDGLMCDCCAERNGYCKTHSNQAPKKDP